MTVLTISRSETVSLSSSVKRDSEHCGNRLPCPPTHSALRTLCRGAGEPVPTQAGVSDKQMGGL